MIKLFKQLNRFIPLLVFVEYWVVENSRANIFTPQQKNLNTTIQKFDEAHNSVAS